MFLVLIYVLLFLVIFLTGIDFTRAMCACTTLFFSCVSACDF